MSPKPILLPLSWLYAVGVQLRNWFFDKGFLAITRVQIPVISVGNLSAGGTGKTPFVEFLAKELKQVGFRPAILSRGYGRTIAGYQVVSNGAQRCAEAFSAGDEPAQMAEKLDGVVIVVDEDRAHGALKLINEFRPDVLLLDDGFQHRSLARDIDILLLTAGEVLHGSRLLPAGYRREPLSSIKRAGLVVVTQCTSVGEFEEAQQKLRPRFSGTAIGVRTEIVGIHRLKSRERNDPGSLKGKKVLAMSAIAKPASFEETLKQLQCNITRHESFPDHHWYTVEDLKRMVGLYDRLGAELLVTTEKDEARLAGFAGTEAFLSRIPVSVVEIGQTVIAGAQILRQTLLTLRGAKADS